MMLLVTITWKVTQTHLNPAHPKSHHFEDPYLHPCAKYRFIHPFLGGSIPCDREQEFHPAVMSHRQYMCTRVSMEVSNYLVSWFITYLQDLQPTYIGVIIHLLIKYHGHPSIQEPGAVRKLYSKSKTTQYPNVPCREYLDYLLFPLNVAIFHRMYIGK